MTQEQRQLLLDDFAGKCRAHHLSLTPQRIAIYKALMDDHTHPSPDKIYNTIKSDFPTISLATVYKTLETFEQTGIISRVTPIHNTVRYDIKTNHHHHVVCVKCKQIMDVESKDFDDLKIPESVARKNRFVNFSVHFSVICEDCLKEMPEEQVH